MIKWSHQAPANGLPASWDEADETIDAAEFQLPADGGYVVDGHPLRDGLIIYKEYETWFMQFVGGIDIFRFTRLFSSFGAFSRRCAIEFFSGRQLVFTGDDIVVHDSQQSQSVLDKKAKTLIRGMVDQTHYRKAFVALNAAQREVWICFPETGYSLPNKALVWSWVEGTLGVRDLPSAAFIAQGIINPIDAEELWSGSGTWNTDVASWGDRSFSPAQRAMLLADPTNTKLHLIDSTNLANGAVMTTYVERQGLGFPLKLDTPPDFATMKQVRGIWSRISGTVGGVVNISLGTQKVPNGPVTWNTPRPYVIGTTEFIDMRATGRLHCLRFESNTDISWRLRDYEVDVVPVGKY